MKKNYDTKNEQAPTQNKHPMNIEAYFDYNNHIMFISTHTKTGTHTKRHLSLCKDMNCCFGFLNGAAKLSPVVVSKLLTLVITGKAS